MGTCARHPNLDTPEPRVPNLRRLREAQNWTRKQLAERISPARTGEHLNVRTLDRWEAGEYTIPRRYWGELSTLFGVSVGYLMGWEDDDPDHGAAA